MRVVIHFMKKLNYLGIDFIKKVTSAPSETIQ